VEQGGQQDQEDDSGVQSATHPTLARLWRRELFGRRGSWLYE